MKRKYLLICVCLIIIFLFGCKCNKRSKITADEIKNDYKYFDVTININNEKYQFIKSSNGYYYFNNEKNTKVYYDYVSKTYYEIDEEKQTKIELNYEYNLNKYIDNIYYILTYHTTKNDLSKYKIEKTTYLDQNVNIYRTENSNFTEEIFVSKKNNICLSFCLKTNDKEINASILSINKTDIDLSKYNNYKTINSDLDTIKDQYKTFNIKINFNGNEYKIIKSSNGYYFENQEMSIYYDITTNKYYAVDNELKTKTIINEEFTMDAYIENIFLILSYHIDKNLLINYKKEITTYIGKEVIKYSITSPYNETIIIDKETNTCLLFEIKTDKSEAFGKVLEISREDIDLAYLNEYKTIINDLDIIKDQYKTFNIKINLNGNEYKFIKASNGYYYENEDIVIYYDEIEKTYYTVDTALKTKTIINEEFTMNAYIENIFFILSYHLDKNLLLGYKKEITSYIGQEVIKYTMTSPHNETIIIDKETNSCLFFELKTDELETSGKILELSREDTDLSYFNDYKVLKQCIDINLPTKEEILNNFQKYTIVLNQQDKVLRIINTIEGFLFLITEDDMTIGLLYNNENNTWYDINDDGKEKSISDKDYVIEELEDSVFSYLTNYLDRIDEKFFMLMDQKYLDRDVTIYTRNIVIKDTLYKQEFIVDNITGICLKQNLNINGKETYFVVEELQFSGDITSYLNYEEVYYSWPKDHEYLIGVNEIEYGKLIKGFEDNDGLNLYYEKINQSMFNYILRDMKTSGFNIDVIEDSVVDQNQNYVFYKFEAINELGVKINIQFLGEQNELIIILSK